VSEKMTAACGHEYGIDQLGRLCPGCVAERYAELDRLKARLVLADKLAERVHFFSVCPECDADVVDRAQGVDCECGLCRALSIYDSGK